MKNLLSNLRNWYYVNSQSNHLYNAAAFRNEARYWFAGTTDSHVLEYAISETIAYFNTI